jgi:hypothetical protein
MYLCNACFASHCSKLATACLDIAAGSNSASQYDAHQPPNVVASRVFSGHINTIRGVSPQESKLRKVYLVVASRMPATRSKISWTLFRAQGEGCIFASTGPWVVERSGASWAWMSTEQTYLERLDLVHLVGDSLIWMASDLHQYIRSTGTATRTSSRPSQHP